MFLRYGGLLVQFSPSRGVPLFTLLASVNLNPGLGNLARETRNSALLYGAKHISNTSNRSGVIRECDRQTEIQTDRQTDILAHSICRTALWAAKKTNHVPLPQIRTSAYTFVYSISQVRHTAIPIRNLSTIAGEIFVGGLGAGALTNRWIVAW